MTKNVVTRRPSPHMGQSDIQAVSHRTGWSYEHGETDEQIDAIEEIIERERAARSDVNVTFSWNVDSEGSGNLRLQATYPIGKPADRAWGTDTWYLAPDGSEIEGVEETF